MGSRTTRERNARGSGISVYKVDTAGGLDLVQVVGDLVNPSFLALNAAKDRLYTVHGDGDEVSVFEICQTDGTLAFIQRQSCGGRNPVHLTLDPTQRWLLVADHLGVQGGGSLVVMPILEGGVLGPVSMRQEMTGHPGPHTKEQPFSKPHACVFDPSGRYVLVPDKGLDRVFAFEFAQGRLSPARIPWIDCRAGAGPRHLAFHPRAPFVYVVNELDSTVTVYRFDVEDAALIPLQRVSTLPDSFAGNNTASEIEVSLNGRFLYASNRGADSIAIFEIDAETCRLRFQCAAPSEGRTPRFFALSARGDLLFALNEESDSIKVFPVDDANGAMRSPLSGVKCGSPVCLVM